MLSIATENDTPLEALNRTFLLNYPIKAARKLETLTPSESAEILVNQPIHIVIPVLLHIPLGALEAIVLALPDESARDVLSTMDSGPCAALLSRLDAENQSRLFTLLDKNIAKELKELLEYPDDTAGKLMNTKVSAFSENLTVGEAVAQMKTAGAPITQLLFLLDDDMRLSGQISVQQLLIADKKQILASLAAPLSTSVSVLDPKDEILEKIKNLNLESVPVIDGNDLLVGVIQAKSLLQTLREDIATDMQMMVGASKDERALSSSWFAVKKRQPWLQINLVTAFLAAAVVGMFEATIAKYTALAILLPIAAGQSGNTGAQALAVTMRGLTLREITVRHWFRVTSKEALAALINGSAIAITCGAGVYFWSGSVGLSLIIALAMLTSMTIAAVAGALVPIVLKKMGQDPALSSSIILTTVTDIAGFMSFLGIATSLSYMLEAG